MNNLIVCEKVEKIYQDGDLTVPVFHDIDLTVTPTEMIGIVGASGAGKSTLLQLMGGLDQPTRGTILVCGKNIIAMSERERCALRNQSLGFIYQFHHLLPEFSVLENVCMPLWIAGIAKKAAAETASTLLEKVGLAHRLSHRISELSGGERQRVAIARALVNHPACVLADEPTGNLDHATAEVIFELMLQLNRSLNTSFVIVTHNESLAKRLNRVLCLQNGKLT